MHVLRALVIAVFVRISASLELNHQRQQRFIPCEENNNPLYGRIRHICLSQCGAWQQSVEEAGIKPASLSRFANFVGKMPRSQVQQILALTFTSKPRAHNYNFIGAAGIAPGYGAAETARKRAWVFDFVRQHYLSTDLLRVTDTNESWTPMGEFDITGTPGGYRPKAQGKLAQLKGKFDLDYWKILTSSNFTLCPGGDAPWSMRFYEAVLAGSIPVISSLKDDLSHPHNLPTDEGPFLVACIGYKYLTKDEPMVYRQDWVDHNRALFLKYQTFMHGDNVPEACEAELEDALKPSGLIVERLKRKARQVKRAREGTHL